MTDTPNTTQDRTLVTFALIAYNQEKYIREAIEGAFCQIYEPLEIILSDDHSSDQTFEIMQEMATAYDGPHEVRVRRNDVNMGLAGHVNTVVQHTFGDIILLAAGDDVSLPDRTDVSVDLLKRNPNATAALLSADIIDHSGEVIGERVIKTYKNPEYHQTIDHLLSWKHITFGATRAFRREIFIKFGPLNSLCPTEDTPLLLRSLICGSNVISQKKGILYRQHHDNLSGIDAIKKMNIPEIYQQYHTDVDIAKKGNFISTTIVKKLKIWILLDQSIRKINADGIDVYSVWGIAKARNIPIRKKLSLLVNGILEKLAVK